jgi:hypothetical protein
LLSTAVKCCKHLKYVLTGALFYATFVLQNFFFEDNRIRVGPRQVFASDKKKLWDGAILALRKMFFATEMNLSE